MWLVYLKLMYDSFGWAKVVIWLLIIYLVGGVLYEFFGWLGIAIPILLIKAHRACHPVRFKMQGVIS